MAGKGERETKPTINDVARLAGVSKKTVSRVINRSPLLNQATREKVEAVIAELDYVPNPQARALALRDHASLATENERVGEAHAAGGLNLHGRTSDCGQRHSHFSYMTVLLVALAIGGILVRLLAAIARAAFPQVQ